MKLIFYGAAETVTGSCVGLTTTKGYKILIDCGLFQGPKELKERNYGEFEFNPSEIDAVLLSHAHIDHSGLIPKLCKKGFKGKIYTTKVTKDLCSIMLPDCAYIQEMEVERKNRKLARANKPLLEPIYTMQDAEKCMEQFIGVSYNSEIEIFPDVKVVFHDAGHILGSAMIEVLTDGQKLIYSGDIGNTNQPIINDPTLFTEADYVIMEATYGNRFHIETEDKMQRLMQIIKKTVRKGGNLVIPAFAVERTQDLIYRLKKLDTEGELPDIDVYVDSPLAIKATEIFRNNPEYFDQEAGEFLAEHDSILDFPGLKYTLTAEESRAINFVKKSSIIISASGMADAGRIKHHLKHNLWRPESTILFVGYQAQGTLGRRILDGEKIVRIHGEEVAVNADIERIEGFSGHADQKGLVEWVENFIKKPKKIFLVHGEPDALEMLAKVIVEKTKNEVVIPKLGQVFELVKEAEIKETIDFEKQISELFSDFELKLQLVLEKTGDRLKILQELDKIRERVSNF